ncbi:hypothetical protein PR202_gb12607 [Eleusine coracana subsp. coracana]|uniref:NB-ARC domain-containing protein n=1 Tax=Eleusine coracana subsp. coracana TaxID=191504 RepID=A0AAV5EN82_ELECO|nr:hypothetical protein PR202_gb12607 [Eleusine coracana subsp. coracana]
MKEFIVLLACCPRISLPPPFSSSSSDDKVMFGRLVEREQIISFLLQPRSNLGVLPIVGDPEAGKGTIVKHVCSDERVRGHFAVIVYSYGSYLVQENCGQDMLRTLRIGGHVLHESSASGHERHLIVIKNTFEVVINLEVWTILCESLRLRAPGSKVIVISEKDNIADLGTAMAMRVNPLPWEEYWYFFMSLAFGGNNDQEEHSAELAVLGRQIAAVLHGSFFGAKVLGGILRMNLNKKFWEGVLDVVNNFNETMQGDGVDHFSKIRVANMVLKTLPLPLKLKSALQQTRSDDLELTGMTVQELLHSAPVPHRKEMRIILWESACPPNYRYIVVCEKVKAEHACVETERKRRRNQQ